MDAQVSHKRGRVRVIGEMTVYTAGALAPSLFAALKKSKANALDLSGVTEFDTAGLQMLLMARRSNEDQGRELLVQEPSEVVRTALTLCQIPLDSRSGPIEAPPAEEVR